MTKQAWVTGQFQTTSMNKIVFKTAHSEVELVSGAEVEASLTGGHLLVGRIGKRDDGLYFLGRMPMFAIPVAFLVGGQGRLLTTQTETKRHAKSA